MRLSLSLFIACLWAVPALASPACLGPTEEFENADLVVYGKIESLLQNKPSLRCKDEHTARAFGQCADNMELVFEDTASRYIFKIDHILKINRQAAGSYSETTTEEGHTKIEIAPEIVIVAAPGLVHLGMSGILFAKNRNEFNDFILGKCGLLSEEDNADDVRSMLTQWEMPLVDERKEPADESAGSSEPAQ